MDSLSAEDYQTTHWAIVIAPLITLLSFPHYNTPPSENSKWRMSRAVAPYMIQGPADTE